MAARGISRRRRNGQARQVRLRAFAVTSMLSSPPRRRSRCVAAAIPPTVHSVSQNSRKSRNTVTLPSVGGTHDARSGGRPSAADSALAIIISTSPSATTSPTTQKVNQTSRKIASRKRDQCVARSRRVARAIDYNQSSPARHGSHERRNT